MESRTIRYLKEKTKYTSSLTLKVSAIIGFIILLSCGVFGYVINNSIAVKLTDSTNQRTLEIARILEKDITGFFDEAEVVLKRMSKNYGLRSNNQIRIVASSMFDEELLQNSCFESIFFIPTSEDIVIRPVQKIPDDYNPTNQEWYLKALAEDQLIWTDSLLNLLGSKSTIIVAIPVYDYSDQLMGVLGAEISLEALYRIVDWKIGETGFVFVVDHQGQIIAHSEKDLVAQRYNIGKDIDITEVMLGKIKNTQYPLRGEVNLVTAVPLSKLGGAVLAQISEKEAYAAQNIVKKQLIVLGLALLLVTSVVIVIIVNLYILKPIRKMAKEMDSVANGQLGLSVEVQRSDEIGYLAQSFNQMIVQLREMILKIGEAANEVEHSAQLMRDHSRQVGGVSEVIFQSIQQVASGADVQVSNVDRVNSQIHALVEGLDELHNFNQLEKKLASNMAEAVDTGRIEMEKVNSQMEEIRSAIGGLARGIDNFKRISEEIDGIIEIINGIANQTNLLALNATIEAARAGETGRGFRVVADEVRKLSTEATDSTEKIRALIKQIKDETKYATQQMDKGSKEVQEGVEVVFSADSTFQKIRQVITEVARRIDESSGLVTAAYVSSKAIKQSAESIAQISEETSASAEEVAAQSEEQNMTAEGIIKLTDSLGVMSEGLNLLIKKFTLE